MEATHTPGSRFLRFGGSAVVDFVNTAPVNQGTRVEMLGKPRDLLEWVMGAGRISGDEAARVEAQPVPRNLMVEALELRESLRGIFQSRVSGVSAGVGALEVLNRWLAEPTTVQGPGRLVERWATGDAGVGPDLGLRDRGDSSGAGGVDLSEMPGAGGGEENGGRGCGRFELVVPAVAMGWHGILPDLARDAAALLTGGQIEHLKRCESPACVLFFLDLSRNGRRRWCCMEICGNRHKVAAHYQRKRGARQGSAGE